MRSLLCTATIETPHERMFRFQRRATSGTVMPMWLLTEGPVLLRRHVRNKGDPLCDEVLLLETNHWYAHIQIATDEKILLRRQTSLLVQTRGLSKNSQVILAVEAEVPNIPEEVLMRWKSRATYAQSFSPWQQATIEIMLAISLCVH